MTASDGDGWAFRDTPEQTVTQVFGSACAVAYDIRGGAERVLQFGDDGVATWEPLASLVLEASYEATILAAEEARVRHGGADGSDKLFLTLLGGGVFGNKISWITDAMERACR